MNKKITKITASIILASMLMYSVPVAALTKDETVYSNLKSNGESYKTIVSTHLENIEDEKILNDLTNLLNIENTSGDETFIQNGETLIWEANSNDIYYKGESKQELPIKMSVKYELDGKEIIANEIAGKTGNVKITIEFKNQEEHKVRVNGKEETMYTPFVVACGTYINNENNKNIEVKNGKIIDDGSKTMVVGLAFPGMKESLNINTNKIEIPEKIEITMASIDFEMENIISVITPKIIEENNLDIFNELDKLYSQVNTLQSASQAIENGAKTLEEGTNEFSNKSVEFNNAINEFSNGMSKANSSYDEINSGINELNSKSGMLQSGSKQLSDGLSQVENGVNQMKAGLNNSSGSITGLITGTENLANGLTTLNNNIVITDNSDTINALNAQIQKDKSTIEELTTKTAKLQELITTSELPEEAVDIMKGQIAANTEAITNLTYDYNYLSNIVTKLTQTDEQMSILKQSVTTLSTGASQIDVGVKTLAESIQTLNSGLETLSGSAGQLSQGANTLYNGTKQLSAGTSKLKQGSSQMKTGLNTLGTSTKAILNADTQLTAGAKTISEGAKELSSGIQEFNQTGIEKICNYINNDIKSITVRAEKLKELSDEYNTFTKLNDADNGKVKFITIVDSIKKDDNTKGQEELDKKGSK